MISYSQEAHISLLKQSHVVISCKHKYEEHIVHHAETALFAPATVWLGRTVSFVILISRMMSFPTLSGLDIKQLRRQNFICKTTKLTDSRLFKCACYTGGDALHERRVCIVFLL